MVVDLQGGKEGAAFQLTDPVIHSVSGDFGATNRRTKGMYKFHKTHKCNIICRDLNLEVQCKDKET